MKNIIENEYLMVEINDIGAEIFSCKNKEDGTEFIWQGDAKYWAGRAPTLFPICGRLVEGKYTYKGKVYYMDYHGFVRTSKLTPKQISKNEIEFLLVSNEKTKEIYPFDFVLRLNYKLEDNKLIKSINVKNTGNEKMPFSFGGHPAFNVPIYNNETFEDYYIEFPQENLSRIIFSEKCFYTGKTEKYALDNNKLKLKHSMFDNDALFFEMEKGVVKLKSNKSGVEISMTFEDMTCVGLWHKTKSDAPFVCIEPWHGVPSDEGVVDDFKTKRQTIWLESGQEYKNAYTVSFKN